MLTSQIIAALEQRIKLHGDLPCYTFCMDTDDCESEISGIRYYEESNEGSSCCGAPMWNGTDICGDCREHSDERILPERFYFKT